MMLMALLLTLPESAFPQLNQNRPAILEEVGIEEKLGDTLPLHLEFTTSNGKQVTLGDLIEDGKPVLLNPVYYNCPRLCGLVIDGVFQVVHELQWNPGQDYTIITFSIDPEETPELASESKTRFLNDLQRPEAEQGWHFLTGSENSVRELTEAIGFSYKWDETTEEFVHASSIMLISPDGVITRYLYGIQYAEFDLRNALYEAADGKIGNTLDRAVLYCFTYDPSSGGYVPLAVNIMKLGGLATLIILGIFLGLFWLKERRPSPSPKFDIQE